MTGGSEGSRSGEGFPLEKLPDLAVLQVAKYLSNEDVRDLSLTCHRFHTILPMDKFPQVICGPDFINCSVTRWSMVNGRWSPLMAKVNRIEISMTWKDSEIGSRKGHLWLQLWRPERLHYTMVAEMRPDYFGAAPHETGEFREGGHHLKSIRGW